MAKKIGDKVWCRLYNTREKRFYGEHFIGTLDQIDWGHYTGSLATSFFIIPDDHSSPVWLTGKEICWD